jgi:hypothetical protein
MQKTTMPLTDEDREIIRKLSDEVRRQQEHIAQSLAMERAWAAAMERPTKSFVVQFSAADGAACHAQTVQATNEEEAQRVGENLAYQEHVKTRFVKVWPA